MTDPKSHYPKKALILFVEPWREFRTPWRGMFAKSLQVPKCAILGSGLV